MKAITFTVQKNGRGYVNTSLVPANHSEATGVNAWGLAIAGGLLLLAAAFILLVLLA